MSKSIYFVLIAVSCIIACSEDHSLDHSLDNTSSVIPADISSSSKDIYSKAYVPCTSNSPCANPPILYNGGITGSPWYDGPFSGWQYNFASNLPSGMTFTVTSNSGAYSGITGTYPIVPGSSWKRSMRQKYGSLCRNNNSSEVFFSDTYRISKVKWGSTTYNITQSGTVLFQNDCVSGEWQTCRYHYVDGRTFHLSVSRDCSPPEDEQ